MGHLNHADKSLRQRVARLKGQVLALERALDGQEVECLDVLTQAAAVRGAAQALMVQLMGHHLREHVAAPGDASARETGVEEMTAVLARYLK